MSSAEPYERGRSFCVGAAVAAMLMLGSNALASGTPPDQPPDKLSQMFTWWNEAMKTPSAFTPEAFAVYFTDDAPLFIDGIETMRGPTGWAERFQMIQGATDAVEIVLPFRYSFQKDDNIYTYHIIRSRAQGKAACMLAAGHAVLRDDKIASVRLVRTEIDPASDPDCWRD